MFNFFSKKKFPQDPKILIIAPAWLGDLVMMQSLLLALRSLHPKCVIDVAAKKQFFPVLERMPEVTDCLELPFLHGQFQPFKRIALGRSWRKRGYDWTINLPNSWKSALVPWATAARRRTGWLGQQRYALLNDHRRLNKKNYPLMIERFMALAYPPNTPMPQPYPWPKLQPQQDAAKQLLAKHNVKPGNPLLILCPGTAHVSTKRWPVEYYAEVAAEKLRQNWQVVLLGTPAERDLAEVIMAKAADCIDLIGKTSLGEAIDMMSQADQMICNDSGLMHISAALGVKLIAIYGSSSPGFTPPLSHNAQVMKLNLPCQPCHNNICPLKHHKCMRDITPQMMLAAIDA